MTDSSAPTAPASLTSTAAPDETATPFTVVTVCTGNICRSPAAEQALRARYGGAGIRFSSAGTGAMVGSAMPEQAAQMSEHLGGDPQAHAGRQLDRSIVENADLVIALAREHRRDVARLVPRAARYTFTLREFARLLESVVADEKVVAPTATSLDDALRSLVPVVAGHRGLAAQPATPDDDDVVDPFRRSQTTYDLAEGQLQDALTRIAAAVDALVARFTAGAVPSA